MVPYNPVSGTDHPLDPPKKPYCRFVLTEALTTADESAEAEITTPQQWGPGLHHCPEVIIHVHNLLSAVDDVYSFTGGEGDIGIAVWDRENHWRIITMLNGNLVGCCLAENHPGRGDEFLIYLGTWDSANHQWCYDTSTEHEAIDWRYGVPYPDEGATGLVTPRASDTYGIIWEIVALDCDTPGDCEECGA